MDSSDTKCKLDFCDKPVLSKELCNGHYAQVFRYKINPRPFYGSQPSHECEAHWCDRKVFMEKTRFCKNCDRRRRRYGLTHDQFASLSTVCEICGSSEKIHIDHNHKTGKYRGTLCGSCNTTIGMSKESIERLESVIKYLRTRNE